MSEVCNVTNNSEDAPEFNLNDLLELLERIGVKNVQQWNLDTQKLAFERMKFLMKVFVPLACGLLTGMFLLVWFGKINSDVFNSLLSMTVGVGLTLVAQLSRKMWYSMSEMKKKKRQKDFKSEEGLTKKGLPKGKLKAKANKVNKKD